MSNDESDGASSPEVLKKNKKEKLVTKATTTGREGKATKVVSVEDDSGVVHAFSESEKAGIVDHINSALEDDSEFVLINADTMEIFSRVRDGVLICKFINRVKEGTIAVNKIVSHKKMNKFEINNNHDLALKACKQLGVQVVNIGATDIAEGSAYHLILGVLWQLVRLDLMNNLLAKKNAILGLVGENLEDMSNLVPEEILLLWVNYHLNKASHKRKVSNFSSDIKDSEAYTVLLHQLDPKHCDLTPLDLVDSLQRAERLLKQAGKIGCSKFVSAEDIVQGNGRLNFAFVANLFNHFQSAIEPQAPEVDEAALEELQRARQLLDDELAMKDREQRKVDERLADLQAQRNALKEKHQRERELLQEQLAALTDDMLPETDAARELWMQLDEVQSDKEKIVREQTEQLRTVADLEDQLEDTKDDVRELRERKVRAEVQIRQISEQHKSEMKRLRQRFLMAKVEEDKLEQELKLQSDEKEKLQEEKHDLEGKFRDIQHTVDVVTADRIRRQTAKNKLENELSSAKRYLTGTKTENVARDARKKKLVKNIRQVRARTDIVIEEKLALAGEVRQLTVETVELDEEITVETKSQIQARNARIALERTVENLRGQLQEDTEFHRDKLTDLAEKQQKEKEQLAASVAKDLRRKKEAAKEQQKELTDLQATLEAAKKITEKQSTVVKKISKEVKLVDKNVKSAVRDKTEIDKKKKELERELRRAKKIIQDEKAVTVSIEKDKKKAERKAAKMLDESELLKKEALEAQQEADMIAAETEEVADAIEDEALAKLAVEEEILTLDSEAALLEEELEEQQLAKQVMLDTLERQHKIQMKEVQVKAEKEIRKAETTASTNRDAITEMAEQTEEAKFEREQLAEKAREKEAALRRIEVESLRVQKQKEESEKEQRRMKEELKQTALEALEHQKLADDTQKEKISLEREAYRAKVRLQEDEDERRHAAERKRALQEEKERVQEDGRLQAQRAEREKAALRMEAESKRRDNLDDLDAAEDDSRQKASQKLKAEQERIKRDADREVQRIKQANRTLEEKLAQLNTQLDDSD